MANFIQTMLGETSAWWAHDTDGVNSILILSYRSARSDYVEQ